MLKKLLILTFTLFLLQSCNTNNKVTKKDLKETKIQNLEKTYEKYYGDDFKLYSIKGLVTTTKDLKDKFPRYNLLKSETISSKKSKFLREEILNYIATNKITNYKILLPTTRLEIDLSNTSQMKGNKDAENTFVIFSDFECPYCSKFTAFENEIAKNKDIKVVYKHFPLSFHKNAYDASVATICAAKQGKFWEFHDEVFLNQTKLSDSLYLNIAKELELDNAKFMECLTSKEVKELLNKEMAEAKKLGVRGTPTYFLNGVKYQEARNITAFNSAFNSYKIIKNEIKVEELKNDKTIILTINDKNISINDLKKLIPNLDNKFDNKLANEAYNLLKEITETDIVNILFTKEAMLNKYKSTEEYVNFLVKTKIEKPTEKQVQTLYEAYKDRLKGVSYEQVKPRLTEILAKHQIEKFFKQKNFELIKKYDVKPLLLAPKFFIETIDTPILGNKSAKNTIFIYSDFQCPFCSKISPLLKKLAKEKNIKIAFKHFPLSFHKRALPAAIASYCAFKQNKFWEFHDKAFANQYELNENNFLTWAKDLKLNLEDFKKCATSKESVERIKKDLLEGISIGVQGTPAMYINGMIYENDPSNIDLINKFIEKME